MQKSPIIRERVGPAGLVLPSKCRTPADVEAVSILNRRKIFRVGGQPVKQCGCKTRTVCFIRVCRCVDIRWIDSARSNVCFAVRMYWISRQKAVGFQDRFIACPIGFVRDSIGHTVADLRMGRTWAGCRINQHDRENAIGAKMVCTHRAYY